MFWRKKIIIFLVLSLTYVQGRALVSVLNYEWRTYPDIRVELTQFPIPKATLRQLFTNIYIRAETRSVIIKGTTYTATQYQTLRNSLIDKYLQ